MVVTNHTFEQMLDMIKINGILGHKIFNPKDMKNYSYLLELNIRIEKNYSKRPDMFLHDDIPLAFGLENAFTHGKKPVVLTAFIGEKGIVARIEDSGEGFNFQEIQNKYMEGKKYFKKHGCGFRKYNSKTCLVSFENEGRSFNVLYFFESRLIEEVETRIANLEEKLGAEKGIF